MALQSTYKQFLAAPNPSLLSENASLHYITTLTTLNGPAAIIKHLSTQSHMIKKKEEKILDAVEASNALVVEVETTMEFVTSGGAYLPGLDDNFLADRTVTLPIIHIVSFDDSGKITQVRQNWDQGSLLKLIDVIGKTGRNWPIRDGKDQIKLIANSVKTTSRPGVGFAPPAAAPQPEEEIRRSRENSTNVTRDPHASLSLFLPRDQQNSVSLPPVVAPRASAAPPPRDYHDLFVGGDSDSSPAGKALAKGGHSSSPSKVVAPKGGAGKNFQPSRLFDTDENEPIQPSAEKDHSTEHFYRPNPTKYQHFDFADGSEPQDAPQPAPTGAAAIKSKHGSNWNFDDFNTPGKHIPGRVLKAPDARSWGYEDDEVLDSPIRQKKVDKPRKDAETHFEFVDAGTPVAERRTIGRPRGQGIDNGMGLYKQNIFDEDSDYAEKPLSRPLNNITNVKDRRKDFDPHFVIADDSPAAKPVENMSQKENAAPREIKPTGIAIAGDGMGGKIGTREASLFDHSDSVSSYGQKSKGISIAGDAMGGRAGTREASLYDTSNPVNSHVTKAKGISIAGDGMGGRAGAARSWGFGDESDGEEAGGLNSKGGSFQKGISGRKQGTAAQTGGGDFWNY